MLGPVCQLHIQNLTQKDSQPLHRKKCIAPQIQYMQFLANMHPEPGKILNTMSTSWCWDTIMKPHADCLHGVSSQCPTVATPFLESCAPTLWHDMPLHRLATVSTFE